MQLKVFSAPELHEALAQVRDALGPDALILDRQVETGADGGRSWKVYAAIDAGEAEEEAPAQPPLLHAMQRLERLVDGIARKEAAGLRNNLETPAARLAFDALLEIGTSPSHAFDIADDFAEGRPLSCPALSWGERLSPQTQREVVVLTGPSGAGKTLLAAKLAAHFSIKGVSVAFLSLDTERIGGVAQLSAYADILGLPCRSARNAQEAEAAVRALGSARLLLIDGEGWYGAQHRGLRHLRACLQKVATTRRFLVIPATMDEEDGMHAIRDAAGIAPTDLIFSKIDEAARPGKLINLAATAGLPLSYCSFGTDVPEHMGWLSPKSMLSLFSSKTKHKEGGIHDKAA